MEDIGQLILGGPKPAAPRAPQGDGFRHENLSPEQVRMALQRFQEMGQNPRMLEKILTDAETFNAYPLEKRQKFFELTTGPNPSMATPFERVPASDSNQPPAQAKSQIQTKAQPASGDIAGDLILGRPVEAQTVPTESARKVSKVKDMAPAAPADQAGPLTQFGRAATSLFDTTLGGIAPGIIEPVTYAGARAFGKSPEQAKEISTGAAKPFEQPLGRALGVTETAEYKGEASRRLMDFIGENFQKGAAWIAEKTGVPVQDVENMMGTAAVGAGVKAAPAVKKGVMGAAEKVEGVIPSLPQKPPETPRIEPTVGKPKVSYAEFQAQLEARKAGGPSPVLPPAPKVQTPTMPAPTVTQPFPEVKYAPKGAVNLPEQDVRKQILSRIGLENARQSSIIGDGVAAANEFQTSKVDAPVGQLYRDTLANERAALENFGGRIIERTGGTLGLDENAIYNRGTRIVQPFDDFKGLLQNQMNQAYDQAKAIAGTQPAVMPSNLQRFLDTDSNFTVNDSFMSLRRGIQAHLKENDLIGPDGRVKPMTVEQAENLRKYINSNWNNERSGIIGRLKDKIDNDVTKVAGEDVYKKARDIRTKIARLLDDPKGVAKIMDYDPQAPMNRAVPIEKIATTVERLSVDQQRHLIKLLKDMPDEMRPQADAAIAEIKAQFANRILQEGSKNKGQWNAGNVTKYLNDNNRKLGILMEDPELAQMVKDLHDAGHILKYDSSYPGAAIQAHNLIRLGAVPALTTLGTSVGGAMGGAMFGVPGAGIGATVGGMAGAKKGTAMAEKSALKRAQKKMIPLKDVGKGK